MRSLTTGRACFVHNVMLIILTFNYLVNENSIYFLTSADVMIGTPVARLQVSFQLYDFMTDRSEGW
ncbi:pyridoxamine 5'-phosphate oxidase family protein, partial [Paenarthrobacter nicotinovorans]